MASWDRPRPSRLAKQQQAALRRQLVDAVGPFSPFWRARLADLGQTPEEVATPAGLAALPAIGERDLCPDGDPADGAGLVLQSRESGFALHAEGPRLRRALVRRLLSPGAYAAVVEGDTRPTTFVWAGRSVRFPLASTRGDLDVVARAGARMWQVLGLSRGDVLVGLAPAMTDALQQAVELAALGAGAPALFAGPDAEQLADALGLLPASVLALPSARAAELIDDVDEAGGPLEGLRTLLLLGAPSDAEREQAEAALERAGVGGARVQGVHVADGHRLPWAQDGDGGYVTSPDLELLHVIDPETGEPSDGAGELVVTQLGLRGSALVRWRTGDLVDAVTSARDGSGRTVPRVLGLRRSALVPTLALRQGPVTVDLRGVSGVLAGSGDVRDWRVEVSRSVRDGAQQLLVHLVPSPDADEGELVVGLARDLRAAAGLLPTQLVVVEPDALPAGDDGSRVLLRG